MRSVSKSMRLQHSHSGILQGASIETWGAAIDEPVRLGSLLIAPSSYRTADSK